MCPDGGKPGANFAVLVPAASMLEVFMALWSSSSRAARLNDPSFVGLRAKTRPEE